MSDTADKVDPASTIEEAKDKQDASKIDEDSKKPGEESKVADKADKTKSEPKKHVKKDNSDTAENEIRVAASGQIKKYLGYAFRILDKTDHKYLTVRATGNAIVKALILIELVKRRKGDLHQLNQIYSIEIVTMEQSNVEGIGTFENRRRVTAMDTILSREVLTKEDLATPNQTKDPLGGYLFEQHPGYQKPEPKEEMARKDNKPKKEQNKSHVGTGGAQARSKYNQHDQKDVKKATEKRQRQDNENKEQDKNVKNEDKKDDGNKKNNKSRKDNLNRKTNDDEFDHRGRGRGGRGRGGRGRDAPRGGLERSRYNQGPMQYNDMPRYNDGQMQRRDDRGYAPPMRGYMNDDFFVRPRDAKNRGRPGGRPMMQRGDYYEPGYYAPPMYDQHGRPNLRYQIEQGRHPYGGYDGRSGQYGYDYNYQNYPPPNYYRDGPGGGPGRPQRGGREQGGDPRQEMRGPPRRGDHPDDTPDERMRGGRYNAPMGGRGRQQTGPSDGGRGEDRGGPGDRDDEMGLRGRGGRGRGDRGRGDFRGRGDDRGGRGGRGGERGGRDEGRPQPDERRLNDDEMSPLPGHGRGRGERGRGRGGDRGGGEFRGRGGDDRGGRGDFRGRGRGDYNRQDDEEGGRGGRGMRGFDRDRGFDRGRGFRGGDDRGRGGFDRMMRGGEDRGGRGGFDRGRGRGGEDGGRGRGRGGYNDQPTRGQGEEEGRHTIRQKKRGGNPDQENQEREQND